MDDSGSGIRNAVHKRPSEAGIASKISGSMGDFEPGRLWEEAGRKASEMMGGCTFPYVEKGLLHIISRTIPLWNAANSESQG